MDHRRHEDPFDNMVRHMSKNDALVDNVEQVSQLNSTQCDPVVVQMATKLSRELNKAKERRASEQVMGCIAIVVIIIIVVFFLAIKVGGRR